MHGFFIKLYIAFCLTTVRGATGKGCDCSRPVQLEAAPACGIDLLTYSSSCLAECQGVAVAYSGPCSTVRTNAARLMQETGPENTTGTAPVPEGSAGISTVVDFTDSSKLESGVGLDAATLNRFSKFGYKLTAKLALKRQLHTAGAAAPPGQAGSNIDPPKVLLASIVTKDGLVYQRPNSVWKAGGEAGAASAGFVAGNTAGRILIPQQQQAQQQAQHEQQQQPRTRRLSNAEGRKMLVVGEDNRMELNTEAYPYSAVGMLVLKELDDTNDVQALRTSGCSAALIGRNSLLTAGHCVIDSATQDWMDLARFLPNQRGGQPSRSSVGVAHYHTYYGGSTQNRTLDWAVLALEEPIGDNWGYLGFGYNCSTAPLSVATAGYPADREPWRMWGSAGTTQPFSGCDPGQALITSDLDTYQGTSGAVLWDRDYRVRAVHVAHRNDSSPVHVAILDRVFQELKAMVEAAESVLPP